MTELYSDVLGTVGGKRRGLSSGSCAQAAAKAALEMLITDEPPKTVDIRLPGGKKPYSGKLVRVPVEYVFRNGDMAEALIRKDAGDDTDITHGSLIGARLEYKDGPGIEIDGAEGVGRITSDGVAGPKGSAAINPIPRKMIRQELEDLLPAGKGCRVVIFVPGGEELAKKTWNPRIGITGGISIIGTKGVVEPKSDEAYKASISAVVRSYRKRGLEEFILTPGYVGEGYLTSIGIPLDRVVTLGDHIGYGLSLSAREGAKQITLAGHIGKLTKIAAGIFNTHWKNGDARLEVIAACAAACGAASETVRRLLDLELAEEAVAIISKEKLEETFTLICRRIVQRMDRYIEGACPTGCILLSLAGESLGTWPKEPLFTL